MERKHEEIMMLVRERLVSVDAEERVTMLGDILGEIGQVMQEEGMLPDDTFDNPHNGLVIGMSLGSSNGEKDVRRMTIAFGSKFALASIIDRSFFCNAPDVAGLVMGNTMNNMARNYYKHVGVSGLLSRIIGDIELDRMPAPPTEN